MRIERAYNANVLTAARAWDVNVLTTERTQIVNLCVQRGRRM